MPATKKTLRDRYRHRMSPEIRRAVYAWLKRDRELLSGRVSGPFGKYDPDLGNRRKNLRRSCAKAVVQLVLNRYNAW